MADNLPTGIGILGPAGSIALADEVELAICAVRQKWTEQFGANLVVVERELGFALARCAARYGLDLAGEAERRVCELECTLLAWQSRIPPPDPVAAEGFSALQRMARRNAQPAKRSTKRKRTR